jgi:hypothetical protein
LGTGTTRRPKASRHAAQNAHSSGGNPLIEEYGQQSYGGAEDQIEKRKSGLGVARGCAKRPSFSHGMALSSAYCQDRNLFFIFTLATILSLSRAGFEDVFSHAKPLHKEKSRSQIFLPA